MQSTPLTTNRGHDVYVVEVRAGALSFSDVRSARNVGSVEYTSLLSEEVYFMIAV